MLTLPKIVAAIREQQPGVVPDEFGCWRVGLGGTIPDDVACDWCDDAGQVFLPQPVAIAVLEAALWWRWAIMPNAAALNLPKDRHSDPLSLIRALCHAIGITLKETTP